MGEIRTDKEFLDVCCVVDAAMQLLRSSKVVDANLSIHEASVRYAESIYDGGRTLDPHITPSCGLYISNTASIARVVVARDENALLEEHRSLTMNAMQGEAYCKQVVCLPTGFTTGG